jgi:hypothetical protein
VIDLAADGVALETGQKTLLIVTWPGPLLHCAVFRNSPFGRHAESCATFAQFLLITDCIIAPASSVLMSLPQPECTAPSFPSCSNGLARTD